MTRNMGRWGIVAGLCILMSSWASAAPLEPLFQVTKITGDCTVKAPDASKFVDALSGKAYGYGTAIMTGSKSSAVLSLSEGNTVTIGADALMTLAEDPADSKTKIARLEKGKIDIQLEKDFQTYGQFKVETAATVFTAQGTVFSVETGTEGELVVAVVNVRDGKVSALGSHFGVDVLDNDDVLSIANSLDNTFTRLKMVKGKCTLNIKDSAGNPTTRDMDAGAVVKIWRRKLESGEAAITLLLSAPDGTLQETISYTEGAAVTAAPGTGEVTPTPTPIPTPAPPPAPAPSISPAAEGNVPPAPDVVMGPSLTAPTPTPTGNR